jgi:hypothetical protein
VAVEIRRPDVRGATGAIQFVRPRIAARNLLPSAMPHATMGPYDCVHMLLLSRSEQTHEIISTTTTQSSIPNINMKGNLSCSISGRPAMTSGTWTTPKRATVIQNFASLQKSRNPMIGNIIATPAATAARPK